MEDEHGNEVPKAKKDAARRTARVFFQLILEKNRAPATWGSVSLDIENELIHILESEHDFLRLCDGHWKAKKLITNSYSQWYGNAAPRWAATLAKRAKAAALAAKAAGTEPIDVNTDDEVVIIEPSKRPRDTDEDTRRSKHPRTEEVQPTPPSRPRPTKVTTKRQQVSKPIFSDYIRC